MREFELIGGSNYVNVTGHLNVPVQISALLEKVVKTKVIVVRIPFRRDQPPLNYKITCINEEVSRAVALAHNADLLSLRAIQSHCYARFGQDLAGKRRIADLLLNSVTPPSCSASRHLQNIPVK